MIENFYFGTLVCLSLTKKWIEKMETAENF